MIGYTRERAKSWIYVCQVVWCARAYDAGVMGSGMRRYFHEEKLVLRMLYAHMTLERMLRWCPSDSSRPTV